MTWKELGKIIEAMNSDLQEQNVLFVDKNQGPKIVKIEKAPEKVYWNNTKYMLLLESEIEEEDKNDDVTLLFKKDEYCLHIEED